MEEEKEEKDIMLEVTEKVENSIKNIMKEGIQVNNIDNLYKLIDIHKDVANEEYWKKKGELMDMRYYEGGEYGADNYGRNYGRSYGRRGVPGSGRGRYRGEGMLDEMNEHFRRYQEGRESYGGEGESMKALQYMLDLDKEFIRMLMRDAKSPEEKELIMEHSREMSEM